MRRFKSPRHAGGSWWPTIKPPPSSGRAATAPPPVPAATQDPRASGRFERWLAQKSGKVELWLGGHTHTNPDDTHGGKSHIEMTHGGTTFINVSALTRWCVEDHALSHRRFLTFEEGSAELVVDCYMHTDDHRPQLWT